MKGVGVNFLKAHKTILLHWWMWWFSRKKLQQWNFFWEQLYNLLISRRGEICIIHNTPKSANHVVRQLHLANVIGRLCSRRLRHLTLGKCLMTRTVGMAITRRLTNENEILVGLIYSVTWPALYNTRYEFLVRVPFAIDNANWFLWNCRKGNYDSHTRLLNYCDIWRQGFKTMLIEYRSRWQ